MTKDDRIIFHTLQAHWWMNSAVTKHCLTRKISHGFSGPEFSDQEKIDEAMNTAKSHIDYIRDLMEDEYESS
jgi:hypothetical protein